ncbi:MAG: Glyoxalase/bleomycin resistance protein/dioxygenase [Chryseobacterium sp.]|jgi:lactoylglutathione lyase/glyoxylase I family protein|uniref:VOC family protein n=1 Tax=Chryseobacterium sp. TaxID=1871047 RepID=UPI00261BB3D2|nr:VOC family protein [Chryseobacterium sp.]MDF2553995.1 Glyoxalase/bleomycin resistance protein/dioxygenase [Chryseobacterium sp.]
MDKTTIQIPAKNAQSIFSSIRGAHVALRVPDFEASKKWYVEKLDFRVIHEWPFGDLQLAYLAPPNDDNFWIELLAGANPKPQTTFTDLNESLHPAGYHHFCLNVTSVDETLAELKRRNVSTIGEPFDLAVIGKRLAFFADLDGNLIELAETIG